MTASDSPVAAATAVELGWVMGASSRPARCRRPARTGHAAGAPGGRTAGPGGVCRW